LDILEEIQMSSDMKKNIQNAMNKSRNPEIDSTEANKNHISLEQETSSEELINTQEASTPETQAVKKQDKKRDSKPFKLFGGICIALFAAAMFFSYTPSVDTSEAAKNALTNKVSTSLSAGTILLSKDESLGAQDYTIVHSYNKEESKIWIWDYAAEDGDYVQVLVNGTPVGDAFMIKNKPLEITIPAIGEVQVKGIRDGGGGITYAVRYELNGTNYFNTAPEGEFNTYTLVRE
jgi:hypothetical protein